MLNNSKIRQNLRSTAHAWGRSPSEAGTRASSGGWPATNAGVRFATTKSSWLLGRARDGRLARPSALNKAKRAVRSDAGEDEPGTLHLGMDS
jgi:hypothetical protein